MERRLGVSILALGLIVGSASALPADAPAAPTGQTHDAVTKVKALLEGATSAASAATSGAPGTAAGAGAAASSILRSIANAVLHAAGTVAAAISDAMMTVVGGASQASRLVGATAAIAGTSIASSLAFGGSTLAGAGSVVLEIGAAALASVVTFLSNAVSIVSISLASAAAALAGVLTNVASVVASLSQSASKARLQVDPRIAVYGGAAVAGSAGLWAVADWLKKAGVLAPLYTRLAPSRLLDNEVRQRIFKLIEENPGVHVSAIRAEMGIGWGTTVYHLSKLKAAHMVTTMGSGNQVCYFKNGSGVSASDQKAIPLLKNPKAKAIREFLTTNPGATQKRVADMLGMSAALVSWHVARLEDAGLLERVRDGRVTRLALKTIDPVAVAA